MTLMVIQTVQDFGFLINCLKSQLPPAQSFQWLVFHWQLDVGTLALPGTYRESTVPRVRKFCFTTDFSRRDLEVLQGEFLFASIVGPVLKTTLKAFNRVLISYATGTTDSRLFPSAEGSPLHRSPWLSPSTRMLRRRAGPGVTPTIIKSQESGLQLWRAAT